MRVGRTAWGAAGGLALTVAAAAIAGALTGDATARRSHELARSGLYGHATKGPITPVCRVNLPCYGPATNAKLIFRRGDVVLRTTTDDRGDYRIALRPGRYIVKSKIGFGLVKPMVVTVQRGRFSRVNLLLATGIR